MDKKFQKWMMVGGMVWMFRGVIVAVALIILVSVVGIVTNLKRSAEVEIVVTPLTATVTLSEAGDPTAPAGGQFSASGAYKIEPGSYRVSVSAEGFETKYGDLRAVAGETAKIMLYLEPLDGNENYYNLHADDALVLGEIKNEMALAKLGDLQDSWPVLKLLPIEIDYYTAGHTHRIKYTVSYELSDEYAAGFRIVIYDYTGGNYNDALRKLEARGVEVVSGVGAGDGSGSGSSLGSDSGGVIVNADGEEASVVYVDKTSSLQNGRAE